MSAPGTWTDMDDGGTAWFILAVIHLIAYLAAGWGWLSLLAAPFWPLVDLVLLLTAVF